MNPTELFSNTILTAQALKRKHKKTFVLNDKEIAAFEQYCRQYKVKNQSKFIRDTVFTSIHKSFDDHYPTLWDKKVLAQLIQF